MNSTKKRPQTTERDRAPTTAAAARKTRSGSYIV